MNKQYEISNNEKVNTCIVKGKIYAVYMDEIENHRRNQKQMERLK